MKEVSRYGVARVDRVVAVLDSFDGHPAGLAEIARRVGLSEATTLRYVSSLVRHGLIERDGDPGRYRLGMRLFQLGQRALDGRHFPATALPLMERLRDRFQETVNLAVRHGDDLVLIEALESPRSIKKGTKVGGQDPWHASAIGKAILALLPESEAKGILKRRGCPRFTANTRTTWTVLARDLQEARQRGYAVDRDEVEAGISCVAAAILDERKWPACAISVSGPTYRITTEVFRDMGNELKAAAAMMVAA